MNYFTLILQAALASDNVFHYLTYEGSVDLEAVVDPVQRASYEAQVLELLRGQISYEVDYYNLCNKHFIIFFR